MSKFLFPRRSGLAVARMFFSVVVLAFVSNALAATYTYNIVDYPAYEADTFTGGTDTISGKLITDSDSGSLGAADFVGGYYSITNPLYGTLTTPVLNNTVLEGSVIATPSEIIILAPASSSAMNFLAFEHNFGSLAELDYLRNYAYNGADGFGFEAEWGPDGDYSANFGASSIYPNLLSLGGTDPWVIATAVPEPSTLTLLAAALLGLGVVYLRRRRAKV